VRSGFTMERALGARGGDSLYLATLVLLAGTGLACLYSASYGYALSLGKSPSYFALRQLAWFLPASLAFCAAAFVPLDRLRSAIVVLVLGSMLLLFLPFAPVVGITKNGASRWFGLGGYMFQPSELFKPMLVLYLAHILSKKSERLGDIINGVIPPFLIACAGVLIVLAQNDFSTALMLGLIAVTMFWVAEAPLVFFVALASIGLPLVSLSVLTSDYRLRRVLGFLVPGHDPANLSYQVNSSLRAIASGGAWGKGLGQGTLKLGSIPEVQSDFVFSAWVEETGFLGVLAFAGLWAFFLFRAYRIAFSAADPFRSHLAFGSATYLAMQVLINVMVVSGAAPATGIPLPLFSAGGSSLVSVALAVGFIYNASRQRAEAGAREAVHG